MRTQLPLEGSQTSRGERLGARWLSPKCRVRRSHSKSGASDAASSRDPRCIRQLLLLREFRARPSCGILGEVRCTKCRRIGWHALRHTFASHIVTRGAPLNAAGAARAHVDRHDDALRASQSRRAVRGGAPADGHGTYAAHEGRQAPKYLGRKGRESLVLASKQAFCAQEPEPSPRPMPRRSDSFRSVGSRFGQD